MSGLADTVRDDFGQLPLRPPLDVSPVFFPCELVELIHHPRDVCNRQRRKQIADRLATVTAREFALKIEPANNARDRNGSTTFINRRCSLSTLNTTSTIARAVGSSALAAVKCERVADQGKSLLWPTLLARSRRGQQANDAGGTHADSL